MKDVRQSLRVAMHTDNQNRPTTKTLMQRGASCVSAGLCLFGAVAVQAQVTPDSGANPSAWVYRSVSGDLIYQHDALGNRVMDFSNAGYMGGGVPLPDVASLVDASRIVQVSPVAGDDTTSIQTAIIQVSQMPIDPATGFRGVVQLDSGTFEVASQLRITASGVVLRGAGQSGANQTILDISRSSRWSSDFGVIAVEGSGNHAHTGTESRIIDKYVPTGARSLRVASSAGFAAGDSVIVEFDPNDQWFSDLGMDQLESQPPGTVTFSGDENNWTDSSGNYTFRYERSITRVEGDRIMFDAPIPQSIDAQYTADPDPNRLRARVYTADFPGRITNVGVENLRGIAQFNGNDEDNAWTLINFDNARDGFVQDVAGEHLAYALVQTEGDASRITVDDAENLDPRSLVTGGRRYAFNIEGELTLMTNLYSEDGRHDFVNNSNSSGPNVFLFGEAQDSNSEAIGPHQRWSVGTLYDNVDSVNGGTIGAWNRGGFGTGHGHSGASMVFWNSFAEQARVENPPTARNWIIGVETDNGIVNPNDFLNLPIGTVDSPEQHVTLNDPGNTRDSLYLAQLAERMRYEGTDFREYVLGDRDDYAFGDAEDMLLTAARLDWITEIVNELDNPSVGTMDSRMQGRYIPLSFEYDLAEDERVVAAVLTLALGGTAGGDTTDDMLYLESLDAAGLIAFSELGLGTGQLLAVGSEVITLEFHSLAVFSLSQFNDGVFNVAIGQDTAIDWAQLQLRVETNVVPGDLDGDGDVDDADFGLAFAAFTGPNNGPTTNPNADLDADGDVDDADFGLFFAAFTGPGGSAANVPEPGAFAVMGCLAAGLLGRKKQSGVAQKSKPRNDASPNLF